MRGTALQGFSLLAGSRITPAHAGNRGGYGLCHVVLQDHPRACGEQVQVIIPPGRRLGSPPRMRGTGVDHVYCDLAERITPAHAGNSYGRKNDLVFFEDHPRACGEQIGDIGALDLTIWITPAHAGNRGPNRRHDPGR